MSIDHKFFDEQIRSLLVARGKFVGKQREADIRQFWYSEFKNLDRDAFQKTINQLKYLGDPREFPSFQEFKVIYRNIRPRSLEPDTTQKFCGACVEGKLLYRDINPHDQITDYLVWCNCYRPGSSPGLMRVDPKTLVKGKDGHYCTAAVLKRDNQGRE